MSPIGHSAWQDASLLHGGVCDAVEVLCMCTEPLSDAKAGCVLNVPWKYAGPIVGVLPTTAVAPRVIAKSIAMCRAAIALPNWIQRVPDSSSMYLCADAFKLDAITTLCSVGAFKQDLQIGLPSTVQFSPCADINAEP